MGCITCPKLLQKLYFSLFRTMKELFICEKMKMETSGFILLPAIKILRWTTFLFRLMAGVFGFQPFQELNFMQGKQKTELKSLRLLTHNA